VLRPQERERAFTLLRGQIKDGKQAFIIYPLIEESDKIEARAAVDDYETLSKEVFPELKLGLLHGRMRPQEKDEAMLKFRDKNYNILVSTIEWCGCAECHRDAHRGRGPLRAGAAPSATRARRARVRSILLFVDPNA
jgi:hypothetical protein